MQLIALECLVYFYTEDAWLVLEQTCMLLTATLFPRVITCNWARTPFYLHLFIYFPFHRVSWFSASFIFRRSALFFHLCHVFSVILLSIFAVRRGEEGVRERQRQLFTVARRRMSCSFSAARVTLVMPPRACGARLSQPSSARIVHGPCASGEPPL